jgi:hypothetical protein
MLQWSDHIISAINRANGLLNAIKIIRFFFIKSKMINLVKSNFYSILFYNSEVWHIPNLSQDLKHCLSVPLSCALHVCLHYPDRSIPYLDLHKMNKRATPYIFCENNPALLFYKTFSNNTREGEWLYSNLNIINSSRQTWFMTREYNSLKIGFNVFQTDHIC